MSRRVRLVLVALASLMLVAGAPVASAATAPPYGLQIVSSTSFVDTLGYSRVVGEVRNNTIFPINFVQVTADFLDGTAVVATESGLTALFTLDPGEKSNFDIQADIASSTGYRLRTAYRIADSAANHNFTVTMTGSNTDADGITHFSGTLTNNNTTLADYVRAEITLYGADGKAADVAFAFIDGDEPNALAAGATAPFSTLAFNDNAWTTFSVVGDSHTPPSLPVRISSIAPLSPIYGSLVKLTGAAAAGAAVTIQRWDRAAGWVTLASTTAGASGTWTVSPKILTTWFIRANTAAGASVPRSATQASLITITSNLTSVRKGASVTLSGIVRPSYAGKKVAIQQLFPPNWKTIGYATLTSSSAWTYRWTAKVTGTSQLRATIADQADSTANVSLVRRVAVH